MASSPTWFEPQPSPAELPRELPHPFDEAEPHALAQRAARELQAQLPDRPADGKMFGVLVVADEVGRVGWLRAFSGQLEGEWILPGWAPPLFEPAAFAALVAGGETRVKELTRRSEAFASSPGRCAIDEEAGALSRRHLSELEEIRERHRARRELRRELRRKSLSAEKLHALDQESRGDKAERRQLDARQAREREAMAGQLRWLHRRLAAFERLRQRTSRALMRKMHDTYVLRNARGETSSLRALFAPGEPPSGAADCAAPKLFAQAFASGLRPLALAEFWWGPPPLSGGRLSGNFYPACREKCGPVLPFQLQGLAVALRRGFQLPKTSPALRVLYEDAWIVVVDKPAGLLSVPGKDADAATVLAWLGQRFPDATGPLLVHRLDLDTSGLLVAARDPETHAALQAQFARREVEKRYVACLEGAPTGEQGVIDLPLRVDHLDRPRQIVDPVLGKPAVTRWLLLERGGAGSRVALFPQTGRTHQLRVHAAHPHGLAVPIVGDRLYGRPGERLLLHAERLSFAHPGTGGRVTVESPAPF